MRQLINDEGINQYQTVRAAYDGAKHILALEKPDRMELSGLLAVIEQYPEGLDWLKLEEGEKYDAFYSKIAGICLPQIIEAIAKNAGAPKIGIMASPAYKVYNTKTKKASIVLPDLQYIIEMHEAMLYKQSTNNIDIEGRYKISFSRFDTPGTHAIAIGEFYAARLTPAQSFAAYRFLHAPKFIGKTAEEKIAHVKGHIELYKLFEDTSPEDYASLDDTGDYWYKLGKGLAKNEKAD